MEQRFDVIVVGSGFGGAVAACRLAEAGARVLVLERGRRWARPDYPRAPGDAWLFEHDRPAAKNGWLDLRLFKGMVVAQGAGVGGGSLTYSSVVMEATPERFVEGWPPEITFEGLAPYYAKVGRMLGVRPIPKNQPTSRHTLMRRAAERLGYADRFRSLPLALSFDERWSYDLADPLDARHSRPFTNAQGQPQGTCVHLGNCDIGCDVQAKNVLDQNYIPAAERAGAEIRPLHRVRVVRPEGTGYQIVYDRIADGRLVPGTVSAGRVVLAAGSLGSTELLLRCRDQYRTLPDVSRQLGAGWSANANVLTPDHYGPDAQVRQGIGPTISGAIDFMDGDADGHRYIVEDDGFPNVLFNALRAKRGIGLLSWALRRHLRRGLNEGNPLGHVMVWLGAGVDAGDGRLRLGRRWLLPWKTDLTLDWDVTRTRPVIEAILAMHRRLSEAGGGRLQVPLYWTLLKALVTVHPLGGCRTGRSRDDGVVDHTGQVYGYPNLFVCDGATIPRPIGHNPSMTIAALTERAAELMSPGRTMKGS
jgi:cholesterol oxidase